MWNIIVTESIQCWKIHVHKHKHKYNSTWFCCIKTLWSFTFLIRIYRNKRNKKARARTHAHTHSVSEWDREKELFCSSMYTMNSMIIWLECVVRFLFSTKTDCHSCSNRYSWYFTSLRRITLIHTIMSQSAHTSCIFMDTFELVAFRCAFVRVRLHVYGGCFRKTKNYSTSKHRQIHASSREFFTNRLVYLSKHNIRLAAWM